VFSVFGSKRSILAELVDISISGGEGAPPILDQAWVQQMREEAVLVAGLGSWPLTDGRSLSDGRP